MTREEAREFLLHISYKLGNMAVEYLTEKDGEKMREAIKALEQEPCEDAISRQEVLYLVEDYDLSMGQVVKGIHALPSVTPQETRKGEWLRMSDLSEQEDDRYKCSRCGNVIHHKNEMDLYTFNSWCGRCGSDNGRHINYEVEE